MQKLTPAHLNGLYDTLEARGGRRCAGLSPKTLANVHGVLHKALAGGVKSGLLARNPADAIAPPWASRAQNDAWTVAELRRFLEHVAGDRLYALWCLFATTGMRRGEALGLVWDDIDLDTGVLRISWTLGVVQNEPTWKPRPKSAAGERTMALDPETVAALRERRRRQLEERVAMGPSWRARQEDWRGEAREDLVFTWPDGRLIDPDRVTYWFSAHCRAAGLRRIRLHDVRHT